MLSTLVLATLASAGSAEHLPYALRAPRIHVGDGTVLENALVLVEGGEIAAVGSGVAAGADVPVIELEGHLSPGLVALRDHSGAGDGAADPTRAVMADVDLAHAFDPDHSEMRRLVEAGVTTVVLAPLSGRNLVGGRAAVVKPGARVLRPGAALHVDLSASGTRPNRYPTSFAGALEELHRRFAEPEGAFAEAAAGDLPVMLEADTRADLRRALAFAGRYGLTGYVVGADRAGELAAAVKASGLGVALGPFSVGEDARHLESAAQLAEVDVPLGFALDGPSHAPELLRWSAAASVRAGLDRDAALVALTSGGAALAGVGDEVGAVRAGLDADLVLWSGDPVDPKSRVLAVYVDGERVYEAPEEEDDEDDEEEDDA